MLFALYGFIWGAFIPYLARRFAKFMPATLAYALFDVCHFRFVWKKTFHQKFALLLRRLRWRSFLYALLTAALFFWVSFNPTFSHWYLIFIAASLLLAEIDYRILILPDIITVPLLLMAFLASCLSPAFLLPFEVAIGAAVGYVLPTLASLFFVWKHKDVFGGGDIKYLSVIGAWLGLENLLHVILFACIIFAIYAVIFRKRVGAFGPALVAASLVVLLF